ncbi:esterase-like activity of phytase family protein [Thalassovita sp.]|jgi:hypothetical protein|uniref:esterase-like activity of phytase family protein n=1 Tax=Thalassovita sp. TaxID=1979401 RepID=UPI003B59E854
MRFGRAVAIAAVLAVIAAMSFGHLPSGQALYVGSVDLPSDPGRLGGYSGLELGPDGRQMVLISDRGRLVRGHLSRQNGALSVTTGPAISFLDRNGRRLSGTANDAEGLAIGPQGDMFISFEATHRVLRYPAGQTRPIPMPRHTAFQNMPSNGGLEALAVGARGVLYAIPERVWTRSRRIPVFRLDQNGWSDWATFPRAKGFLPVGADLGPDGRLYVLERHFKGLGFASQVRSFIVTAQGLADERLVLRTRERQHGNLEGLAVWRDDLGQIRLTMVADNNFLSLLPNTIVEYVLPKTLAKQGNQD